MTGGVHPALILCRAPTTSPWRVFQVPNSMTLYQESECSNYLINKKKNNQYITMKFDRHIYVTFRGYILWPLNWEEALELKYFVSQVKHLPHLNPFFSHRHSPSIHPFILSHIYMMGAQGCLLFFSFYNKNISWEPHASVSQWDLCSSKLGQSKERNHLPLCR